MAAIHVGIRFLTDNILPRCYMDLVAVQECWNPLDDTRWRITLFSGAGGAGGLETVRVS